MRRYDSGTGCGACGCASQARLRDAPGSRPTQLRGSAFKWLDAGRMNGGESCRDQVGQMASVRPRKHGPGVQSRRGGAP